MPAPPSINKSMISRTVVPVCAFIAYTVSFFLLYPVVGVAAAVPSLVPVIITAWYFKVRGGVIGAIISVSLNMLLGYLVGLGWLTLLRTGGGLGPLVMLLTGLIVGRLRDLSLSLQRANEQMAATLNALPDLMFEVDRESRIFSYHAPHPGLLYLPPENLVGKVMTELVPAEAASVIRRAIDEAAATGHHQGGEYVLSTETGSRYFSLSIAAKGKLGTPACRFILLARDVTESKQAEEALRQSQKIESLGVLAGGIAHDFNNLLTGILGHLSLARRCLPADSPAGNSLETAGQTAERAADLTQQLLAYAGKGQVKIVPLNLNTLIHENVILLESALPKTITLDLQLTDDLPFIKVDGGQIQQVIMNLIINAAEAYEGLQGQVAIRTWTEFTDNPQADNDRDRSSQSRHVFFSVKDNGKGMDDETLSHVFDPFFTTKATGRGLGLSAVSGIIREHGGDIQVDSSIDQGTTFKICIPATQEPPISETPVSIPPLSETGTVLIVDDENVIRSVFAEFLRSQNYTVLTAENGKEGLAMYRKHAETIDFVLLDLTMPVMSGSETLTKLRELEADVPVLLMSGFGEVEVVQQIIQHDKVAFLQKPFELDRLLESIHALRTEVAR